MDINKVTTAMIDYYQGQPKRIQQVPGALG